MNREFSLEQKTALVTGSTRGIGKAIALALARAGARVVLHGTADGDRAERAVSEVRALGGDAWFVPGDLSAPGGGRAVALRALELAPIDILVLNASVQFRAAWPKICSADALLQMQANFHAPLEMIGELARGMLERKWGRILAIGSVQEARPHPDMAVYAASKAAQTSLMKNFARQFAPSGVTCNTLAPGVIETDRNADALADDTYAKQVRDAIPSGFFGTPDDCAGAALLLCSDASRYITGQTLFVDGGLGL
jgi:NAD(P)-dependent dehydrogenase (short-subunit alcohol dehydrogenase family)